MFSYGTSLALLENVGGAGVCRTLQGEFFSKSSENSETFLGMTLNIVSLVLEGEQQGWSMKQFARQVVLVWNGKTHVQIRYTML